MSTCQVSIGVEKEDVVTGSSVCLLSRFSDRVYLAFFILLIPRIWDKDDKLVLQSWMSWKEYPVGQGFFNVVFMLRLHLQLSFWHQFYSVAV